MNKEKIAFCTYVSDEYYHSLGAHKLVKSAAYFHPEIPMFAFGTGEINEISKTYDVDFGLLHPFFIDRLLNKYERVVYFDADGMLVGPITEIFEALDKHDIVCVRNNNDQDRAGMNEPITWKGVPVDQYVNGGLIATRNPVFINNWMHCNREYGHALPFKEQDVLNIILKKHRKYAQEMQKPELIPYIVDHKNAGVYYGVSCLSGEGSHWDSWKQIELVNDELILNGKTVKVLHHAGGFKAEKLDFNLFSAAVAERLNIIIS